MAKGPTYISDNDLASIRRRDWVFRLQEGATLNDALKPAFWANVGKKLNPFDRIELQAEAPTKFVAELVVVAAGQAFAKVKLLAYHDLTDEAAAVEAEGLDEGRFTIKHEGFGKWMVVRNSDKVKMKGGFGTKEDAQLFAINHQRLVTA